VKYNMYTLEERRATIGIERHGAENSLAKAAGHFSQLLDGH